MNHLENLVESLPETTIYSSQEYDYPSLDLVRPYDGVEPEMFYTIYNNSNSFSELSAIISYTTHKVLFPEISELFLGIGLVEMKHYDKLGELISKLGGTISQSYSSENSLVASTTLGAIDLEIEGEIKTIEFYNDCISKLSNVLTETSEIVIQFLTKIISDEEKHLQLLREAKENLSYIK